MRKCFKVAMRAPPGDITGGEIASFSRTAQTQFDCREQFPSSGGNQPLS
jgi:hypothetical protein